MNEQQLEKKVRQDEARVKKDVSSLVEDRAAQFSQLEGSLGKTAAKATKDLSAWLKESTAQVTKKVAKLAGGTKETVEDAAGKAQKTIGHQLSQYNATVQDAANKIPDGFSKKAKRYPWVAISIGVAVGFLLGIILKPSPVAAQNNTKDLIPSL